MQNIAQNTRHVQAIRTNAAELTILAICGWREHTADIMTMIMNLPHAVQQRALAAMLPGLQATLDTLSDLDEQYQQWVNGQDKDIEF